MVFIFPMPSQVILTLPANTSEECQKFLNAGDTLWIRKTQALPQQLMQLIINQCDKCLDLFTELWGHRWGTPNPPWESFISSTFPTCLLPSIFPRSRGSLVSLLRTLLDKSLSQNWANYKDNPFHVTGTLRFPACLRGFIHIWWERSEIDFFCCSISQTCWDLEPS